jgi:hypothetical protein
MAFFKTGPGEGALIRIADSLEALVGLYTKHLVAGGVLPDPEAQTQGAGEVIETDDEQIARLIEKKLEAIGFAQPGLYVGDEPDITGVKLPEQLPIDQDSLFGNSWGLNVGPEGAEEGWGITDGRWSETRAAPGDVQGQGSGEKSEG